MNFVRILKISIKIENGEKGGYASWPFSAQGGVEALGPAQQPGYAGHRVDVEGLFLQCALATGRHTRA